MGLLHIQQSGLQPKSDSGDVTTASHTSLLNVPQDRAIRVDGNQSASVQQMWNKYMPLVERERMRPLSLRRHEHSGIHGQRRDSAE